MKMTVDIELIGLRSSRGVTIPRLYCSVRSHGGGCTREERQSRCAASAASALITTKPNGFTGTIRQSVSGDLTGLGVALGMFRIVLQPEEQEILHVIREGHYPACMAPGPLLLKLMALRMLVCDEHGGPQLTELAEAALLRMNGELH